eukprot:CAMPEP_0113614518 /NCGR_PEP_ID=MMETSP0017_2-20120614/7210_1 /TAXON_ID=2856 /ORGANISM="Cylindrotheca closterium" /LENGTH=375 /DNA_ID=CAMNT_0000523693 /DNA_START=494 /DNA_END=1618 /DNA_ORIENTATION=+ /assembly_acc=CAM_ASM_000147
MSSKIRGKPKSKHEQYLQERFEELCAYKEANGHCRVPSTYKENKKLGNWVVNMRRYHKEHDKKQDPVWKERFAQLEAIGFEWEVMSTWQERLNDLREYKEANGHCRVPIIYENNKKLGNWVNTVRKQYKDLEKKENPLWKNRFAQLEALGFEREGSSWQEHFEDLCVYKEAHGNCRVPKEYEKSTKLGHWVKLMRRYYKEDEKKQHPVWKERFAQLEALGFEWVGSIWQQRFEELCEYKEANGNCRVPKNYDKNKQLGYWVPVMRRYYKEPDKKQDPVWKERFAQLEAIGFDWEVAVSSWQERLNELLEYKQANGHCQVPVVYEKNKKLEKWVNLMRRYYKDRKRKQNPVWKERFAQLEALGFDWEGNTWQQRFE